MAELAELLQRMLPPLRVEYRTGCRNYAGVGGFDAQLLRLVRQAQAFTTAGDPARGHLDRLEAIFSGYLLEPAEQRAKLLREAKRRLDALLEEPRPETHAPSPPDRPAPPSAPARGGHDLSSPIQYLKGVGPQRAKTLARLGLETIGDLLFHFPRRHEDRSHMARLGEVAIGQMATFEARVRAVEEIIPRRGGVRVIKAMVSDGSGWLDLVWFNQPWLRDQLAVDQTIIFSGRVQVSKYHRFQIVQPAWEILEPDADPIHTGRLVPIYPLTEGLPQTTVRRWVKQALDHYLPEVVEVLPPDVREDWDLVGRPEAIRSFHFPESEDARLLARRRLVFEEFFGLQVALAQRRHEYDHRGQGIAFETDSRLVQRLHELLPFDLTGAQQRVLKEIQRDLAEPVPMNRLVQGDVGSGKTLVALSAMLTVVDAGYQAALMVPTEILAEQHHRVLRHWCEPLGVTCDLLTGRAGTRQRRESLARLRQGETQIAVGTHALYQEAVDFDALGLVVVDEQHRFGVLQRKLLSSKGVTPDVLVMTATPIPRTLALTVYGELDVSTIDELPAGRQPIATSWWPLGRRRELYQLMKERLREGRQAYVVCPLVEESESLADVEAATAMAEHLREHFKTFTVGLVHGRLKSAEKDEVMDQFRAGTVQILAATTVIEVGIDVPNATMMLIVNADRFGLAQLHQLRGRVGRGSHESACFLLTDAKYNPELADDENALQYRDARARLRLMVSHTDGFKLAEADLDLRGPGELGGTRQSGSMDFRVANLARDAALLELTREAARDLVRRDPYLAAPGHETLAGFVEQRFRERGKLAEVG